MLVFETHWKVLLVSSDEGLIARWMREYARVVRHMAVERTERAAAERMLNCRFDKVFVSLEINIGQLKEGYDELRRGRQMSDIPTFSSLQHEGGVVQLG